MSSEMKQAEQLQKYYGPKELTYRVARQFASHIGIDLRYDVDTYEFRVNYRGGKEATAYYTDDLKDALGTAILMSQETKQR